MKWLLSRYSMLPNVRIVELYTALYTLALKIKTVKVGYTLNLKIQLKPTSNGHRTSETSGCQYRELVQRERLEIFDLIAGSIYKINNGHGVFSLRSSRFVTD